MIDLDDNRLEIVKEIGVMYLINFKEIEIVIKKVKLLNLCGVDVVIEVVGIL